MNGLAEDGDHADKAVFPQHRHQQQRRGRRQVGRKSERSAEIGEVSRLLLDINDMNELRVSISRPNGSIGGG